MSVTTQRPFFGELRLPGFGRLGWRTICLACGAVFPFLWVGMDIAASLLHDGFSYRDQTISELSAIGAPTRTFWFVFGTVYSVLEIGFAVGIWQSAGRSRALRVVAGLFAVHAIINLTLGPFSSMHQRAVLAADGATLSDTLHLIIVGVGGIIFLFQSGFAAVKFGNWFRFYSLGTVLATLVFGFITSSYKFRPTSQLRGWGFTSASAPTATNSGSWCWRLPFYGARPARFGAKSNADDPSRSAANGQSPSRRWSAAKSSRTS